MCSLAEMGFILADPFVYGTVAIRIRHGSLKTPFYCANYQPASDSDVAAVVRVSEDSEVDRRR